MESDGLTVKILSLILATAISTSTIYGFLESRSGENCRYSLLAFPEPARDYMVPQVGLAFGSKWAECYVPEWLQDSVASFLPKWVESSRNISEPIGARDFIIEKSSIWLKRIISFDSSSTSIVFEFRQTPFRHFASSNDESYRIWSPVYVAADLASRNFFPLVHGTELGFLREVNNAIDGCPQLMPADLLCRTKFVLALEYENQQIGVVVSTQEIAQTYMLFGRGEDLGYISGDELFLGRPLPDLEDKFYTKKEVNETLSRISELPKEFVSSIKPPIITKCLDVDSVRLWVYAFDCGEVAEWAVTYDKSGRLLSLDYARQPERTISGGLSFGSPYDRMEKERKKAMER